MTLTSRIRRPEAATAALDARQVALAYNYPLAQYTGKGVTIGIIELGGAVNPNDVAAECTRLGIPQANVTAVPVDGATPTSDGPNGADGEVMLDVEVIAAVAPGAAIRCYFAPNTDQGFLDAIRQATAECDYVSISWGGPESSWDGATMDAYEAVFAEARKRGVTVFCASGDTGSTDGTSANVADFPASSPSVVGCGGTRLTLDANGARAAEVTWNDSPTQSATGGGVSKHFPGRQVPDVAGNADPQTGYKVIVDGGSYVIGGTSAVAPLYAGLAALMREAYGKPYDMLNLVVTNPTVCFDVTQGNNGGYKAGPGRDDVTGYGVVDGEKLLAVLTSGTQIPAPGGNPTPTPPTPTPTPTPQPPAPTPQPTPTPAPVQTYPPSDVDAWAHRTIGRWTSPKRDRNAAEDYLTWRNAK